MISNGFFFFRFFTSLVILGFPKKEITLFDKTQFCCLLFFATEWMNGSGLVMCIVFFYVMLHTYCQLYMFYQSTSGICCVWTGRGLYALFFRNSFFLFDQSGYQKHAGGFLWLFNASLYGLICTKTVTFSRYSI